MLDDTVLSKVADVLAVTLRVLPESVTGDFSPAQCGAWDSVRHLMIMLAIEDKFGITFSEREITELTSLTSISNAVRARQLKQ